MRLAASVLSVLAGIALPVGALHAAARSAPIEATSAPLPARVQLDYTRAPGAASCVSPEQLAQDVEVRLGRPVFVSAGEADLVARVRARRVSGRFTLEVELLDASGRRLGQRELSTGAAHCSSLDDSLALVLALAADAPRAAPESPVTRASAAEPAGLVPRASLDTAISIPASTHAPRFGWRWAPSAGLALASGLLPSAALGLELGLELRPPDFWALSLRGTWWVEQGLGGQPRPGRGAEFAARTFELGVCPWAGQLGPFGATLCALQWVGRIDARGSGFDQSLSDTSWFAAAGLAPALAYGFGPVRATLAGTLLVPLVRRRYFSTDGADITLHEQPWLFGALGVRLGVEF
jgi:hypothetical protein